LTQKDPPGKARLRRSAAEPLLEAPPPRHAADGALQAALVRSLILAAHDHSRVSDTLDCAELALSAGLGSLAKALFEIGFLWSGFGPEQQRWQGDIDFRTGFWPGRHGIPADEIQRGFSLGIAVVETAGLLSLVETDAKIPLPDTAEKHDAPSPIWLTQGSYDAASAALVAALRAPSDLVVWSDLRRLMEDLAKSLVADGLPDINECASDLDDLGAAFVRSSLRQFVLIHAPLALPPFGSPQLFHRSARLSSGGLGAYLGNVETLIRHPRDIWALVQAAGAASDLSAAKVCVAALLTLHLHDSVTADLADTLGDQGDAASLEALWEMVEAKWPVHKRLHTAWRVRDAALDNRLNDLAIRAQVRAALHNTGNPAEWRILGDMHATFGALAAASASYRTALDHDPGDSGTVSRMLALERHEHLATIDGGIATPPYRKALRAQRFARPPMFQPATVRREP